MERLAILGGARSDFQIKWSDTGKTLPDIMKEVTDEALQSAGLEPKAIDGAFVSTLATSKASAYEFYKESKTECFNGQQHMGGFMPYLLPGFNGPTASVEAACASGGVAVRQAHGYLAAGFGDTAMVLGVEQMRTMSAASMGKVLAAAADMTIVDKNSSFPFPCLFAEVGQKLMEKHGLTEQQLARVVHKAYDNARRNPKSQTRGVDRKGEPVAFDFVANESKTNPRFAPPLKVTDASQVTDGAAALILCTEKTAKEKYGIKNPVTVLGWGWTTDNIRQGADYFQKNLPNFPVPRKAADDAYKMAGLSPKDMNAAVVHDCFSPTEWILYYLLGFVDKIEDLPAFVDKGEMEMKGRIPVNPFGGLMADGHPVGATGVLEILKAFLLVSGKGGDCQVEKAKDGKVMVYNIGGRFVSNVCHIVGRS